MSQDCVTTFSLIYCTNSQWIPGFHLEGVKFAPAVEDDDSPSILGLFCNVIEVF